MPDPQRLRGDLPSPAIHSEAAEHGIPEAINLPIRMIFHPPVGQATILQVLGFDHERLTFRHAGRDFRLTDVSGKVVQPILA